MELQYMYNLKKWKDSKKWNDTGVEESKITQMESKYEILFPLAYREFLIFSGLKSAAIAPGHMFEFLEEKQKEAQKLLKNFKLNHLIKKPFWVIATDANAFWYFHLDEGDNPPVYRLDCEYYEEYPDKYSFGKIAETFQAWIEKGIEYYEMDPANK
ncbi:SMI1/KNR4 family protein [uncultured Kordia sp.]|uniref:SMI1/KNR4 family protein n=1 Tax=uncultured Kordia sp. TaxID=507699 RepID=UPI002623FEF4|nr:SMI1/KNR4 family protein [uncultured Kordia sp.]